MIDKFKLKSYFSRNVITLIADFSTNIPLHLRECFAYLNHKKGNFPICEQVSDEIMSLPMNPYVTDDEIEYINKAL